MHINLNLLDIGCYLQVLTILFSMSFLTFFLVYLYIFFYNLFYKEVFNILYDLRAAILNWAELGANLFLTCACQWGEESLDPPIFG